MFREDTAIRYKIFYDGLNSVFQIYSFFIDRAVLSFTNGGRDAEFTSNLNVVGNLTAPNICYANGTNCNATSGSTYNSSYVPYTGATQNINIGENNITTNGTIYFIEGYPGSSNTKPILQVNPPGMDGFTLEYSYNFEDMNDDWLVFKKTDGNDPMPDGGIAFVMTNASGYNRTILKMDGYNTIEIKSGYNFNVTGGNVTADYGFMKINWSYIQNFPGAQWLWTTDGTTIYNKTMSGLGLGVDSPHVVNMLDVEGGVAIRSSIYEDTVAPDNGLFVEEEVYIGGSGIANDELNMYEPAPSNFVTTRMSSADTGSGASNGFKLELGTAASNSTTIWNYENGSMIFGTNNKLAMTITNETNVIVVGNVTASNFFGYLDWSYILGAPAFLTSQLFPSTTDVYLYNDTGNIYFNETKLNETIDARSSTGGNSSWNETRANSLYTTPGNCPEGQVVQNTTNGGVECVEMAASGGGDNNAVLINNVNTYNTVTSNDNRAYPSTALVNNIITYEVTNVSGDILPTATETYSIGSLVFRWLKGWFTNLDVSGDALIGGNLNVSGNITGNNYYGDFYNKVYGGFERIDLVTTEVYVAITNSSCGLQNGFTCVNSTGNLTANVGGVYKVSFTVSAEPVSNSGEYGTKLFVNGVGKDNCYAFNNFLDGNSSSGGFNCIVRISAGDVLNIEVDDHANPVRDLIINSMNLNLMRVGN
jgi:hypothetical protein